MAATQAVFKAVELFEDIHLQTPGHRIPLLQLVSKHWKEVIESSTAIHHYYHNYALVPIRLEGSDSNIPIYEKSSNIKLHPVLRTFLKNKAIYPCAELKTLTLHPLSLHSPLVMSVMAEFATIPLCQRLQVREENGDYEAEILEIEGGVRISDLVKMGHEMDERKKRNAPVSVALDWHLMCPYTFFLIFKEEVG